MNSYITKFRDYLLLMRADKPIGIFLLLWPTLWALWFAAGGMPTLHVLLVFVGGTVLMRSAGCAINDFADRDFDPRVARTRNRPLVTGRVTPEEAVRVFVVIAIIAFGLLTSLKNTLAILWSVPAVLLAAAYPFTKRVFAMPQAILGLAFSAGIPMAYAAVLHRVEWTPVLQLVAANLCWVIAYDTLYAMADREDDLKIGVKSSAILFGRHDLTLVALLHMASLLLLAQLGWSSGRGWIFFTGLAGAAALATLQQHLIRNREPSVCMQAFLQNNYFGLVIFVGLALDYAVVP
ncbi:MAG: 4-hydroxybenzoate octaprenyltransferase [Pseudomonadota bacterium]